MAAKGEIVEEKALSDSAKAYIDVHDINYFPALEPPVPWLDTLL